MKQKILLLICGIGALLLVFFCYKTKLKTFQKEFSYLDSSIIISIKTKKNGTDILSNTKKIYQEYERLIDRENSYQNMNNLYYLLYNHSDEASIAIDKKLYHLISYGKKWYEKSDGKIDISLGNVMNIWNMYIDSQSGYPSESELKRAKKENIGDIILQDNYHIKNNHVNIYLDDISTSYVTEKVIQYLKKNKIKDYQITIDHNIYVGDRSSLYKIAITNPFGDYTILKAKNIAVNNRYESDHSYTYDGTIYSSLISPITLKQPRNMKGISVITKNVRDSDAVSLMLYMMDQEEAVKYVEKHNIEAIIYTNDNQLNFSTGMKKYIK